MKDRPQQRSPQRLPHRRRAAGALAQSAIFLELVLASLSGCLWFLSSLVPNLSVLAWFAMVPLLFAVDAVPTRKRAALLGLWAGTVANGGGFYWLIELLRRFANFPLWLAAIVFLLFSAYQGTVFMLFVLVVRTVRERKAVPMVLVAPVAMVTFEMLIPFIFPSYVAISQAWHPLVIQIADLTGPLGVTALLLVSNGVIYDVLILRRRALRPAVAGIAVLAAALVYGGARMAQFDRLATRAPKLLVGVVQPNVAYDLKGVLHPELALGQLAALQQRTRELSDEGAQLVVWSEGSYPYRLPADLVADFPAGDPRRIRGDFTTPVVVGALSYFSKDLYSRNSAFLLDSSGQVAGRYDKVWLLAFGERIPAIGYFPWLRRWVPRNFGSFLSGSGAQTLPFTGSDGRPWRLGPVICYEDILPWYLRQVGALHPDLMVNLTNDTWFGATAAPWQHLALAVFGSVEQRVSMVRAVDSGVSAFVDPNGRVVSKTYSVDPYLHPVPADKALATLPLLEGGHTVYEAVGNLFGYLCAAVTAALTWLAISKRS